MLYYYWTNFWFLTPTIFISFLLVITLNAISTVWGIVLSTIVALIYLLTLDNYWVTNSVVFEVCLRKESLNLLLTNSINKYHPLLFYVSLFYLTSMFFRIKYSSSKQKLNETRLINHSLFFLILNLFTLSLGGWWALQEGSWGGWWNWDPSETFGLMVMLFYVITLHLNIIKLRNKWYRVYIYLFFCTIILYG